MEAVSNDFTPDVAEANVCLIYNRKIEHSGPMITGRAVYLEPFSPSRPFLDGSASAEIIIDDERIISIPV